MTKEVESLLSMREPEVARLCRSLAVRELRLFGSSVADDFDHSRSDMDLVAEFADHDKPGIADRYLALAEGLEAIFGRPVDLLTPHSIRNPYFRREVEETGRLIYAA